MTVTDVALGLGMGLLIAGAVPPGWARLLLAAPAAFGAVQLFDARLLLAALICATYAVTVTLVRAVIAVAETPRPARPERRPTRRRSKCRRR